MRPRPVSQLPPVTPPETASDYVPDIPFTPVPSGSRRHDGWTPERQRAFIAHLGRLGVVSAAAGAVGMSAKSAYGLRKRAGAESFGAAWDTASDLGRLQALDHAIDRAVNGILRPIVYRGRQVGVRRVFDNRLLLAAIRTAPQPAPRGLSFQQMLDAIGPATEEPE